MPPKKKTKEEILLKAKLARRERYAKIKADPVKYALEKEKEHQRYLKRKEEKKILSIEEMTPRAKKLQRQKWRESYKRHYTKKKLHKIGLELMDANTPNCSDVEDPLEIRQNQNNAQNPEISNQSQRLPRTQDTYLNKNLKKRLRRLRYLFKVKEQQYKLTIKSLQNRLQKSRKTIYRLKKRLQSPNSKAIRLIKDKSKMPEVKKKVLFGEAMKKTLETNFAGLRSTIDKRIFSETVIPDKTILKEHKVLNERRTFTVRDKKEKSETQNYFEKLKKDIIGYLERDDVSRMTAGKKETITVDKIKKQKRYLLDSMKNIHKSFEEEFGKVSYSYFCKQRPKWVCIPDVDDRETCLCKIHSNITYLIKALHKQNILSESDTREVIHKICCPNTSCLLKRCDDCKEKKLEYNLLNQNPVTFYTWQNEKETFISKGKETEKRIVIKKKVTLSPKEAAEELEKMIPLFLIHEGTRKWQFNTMKDLKEHIKENEAVIHIDFSENYAFKYESEIQAFHFGASRKELTLHTAVIYFLQDEEKVCQSFCTVSENLRHDAAAVWAHIIPLIDFTQNIGNIDTLHFISDSPSSQYRNKTMFYIISKLYWHFQNLKLITWNYTEAGHGKGAADGVGGTVKRTADAAVAKGKDIVSIDDFMSAVTQGTDIIKLEVIYDYQIYEKDLLIPSEQLKPLKGTTKVHQVLWKKENHELIFRTTSCFFCLDTCCGHTELVGTLTYNTTENLPHSVQPKEVVFGKPAQKKTNMQEANKENVRITSNLLIKPAQKLKSEENLLPDNPYITGNSKMNLKNVNIDEMVDIYNVSGIECNFSGVFESFVRSKNELSISEDPYNFEESRGAESTNDIKKTEFLGEKAKFSQSPKQKQLLGKSNEEDIGHSSNQPQTDSDTDNSEIFMVRRRRPPSLGKCKQYSKELNLTISDQKESLRGQRIQTKYKPKKRLVLGKFSDSDSEQSIF